MSLPQSECDRCVDTLLNSTQDIEVSVTNHWTSANMLQQLQERDAALMTLEPQINDSYVQMTSLLEQLTELRGQLEGIHIDNITTISNDLQGVVSHYSYTTILLPFTENDLLFRSCKAGVRIIDFIIIKSAKPCRSHHKKWSHNCIKT